MVRIGSALRQDLQDNPLEKEGGNDRKLQAAQGVRHSSRSIRNCHQQAVAIATVRTHRPSGHSPADRQRLRQWHPLASRKAPDLRPCAPFRKRRVGFTARCIRVGSRIDFEQAILDLDPCFAPDAATDPRLFAERACEPTRGPGRNRWPGKEKEV